jgi:predicted metal-dependent HD superfamily phosphohydrolase
MDEMTKIQQQWKSRKAMFVQLWNQVSLQADDAHVANVCRRITIGYSESHRYYHSQRHILFCLEQFDRVTDRLTDSVAVAFATWFHDLILDPSADDNEEQSKRLFQELAKNYLPVEIIEKTSSLIMSTCHIDTPANLDESYIQDIDLSSMGEGWDSFVRDVDDLRKEYSHLSNEQFVDVTNNFYQKMLGREKIYTSDYFYEHCEQKARDNIKRYMREILNNGE